MTKRRVHPKLVISCHADTGFKGHRLRLDRSGLFYGHLDNFVGVHAVMKAFFSGRLDRPHVRIELTGGEETDMAGAFEVLETLEAKDVVIVVDVTGTPTQADIVIEKCRDAGLRRFIRKALAGLSLICTQVALTLCPIWMRATYTARGVSRSCSWASPVGVETTTEAGSIAGPRI